MCTVDSGTLTSREAGASPLIRKGQDTLSPTSPSLPESEPTQPAIDEVAVLAKSWKRSLRAANKSQRTIQTYGEALERFQAFAHLAGMPPGVANVRREHIEAFIEDLLRRFKPNTAANRFKGLQRFFAWLLEEGEIARSRWSGCDRHTFPRCRYRFPPMRRWRAC